MAPPSQLSIATSSLVRLVREEASYHKELLQQQSRLAKSEQNPEDENAEYTIQQEKRAIEETKVIFPQLKDRIRAAMEKLEEQLEAAKDAESEGNAEEIARAREAIAQAKASDTA